MTIPAPLVPFAATHSDACTDALAAEAAIFVGARDVGAVAGGASPLGAEPALATAGSGGVHSDVAAGTVRTAEAAAGASSSDVRAGDVGDVTASVDFACFSKCLNWPKSA